MNGWIDQGDVFHECTLDTLPFEIGQHASDLIEARSLGLALLGDDAKLEQVLIAAGCIQVDEFHGLARFRGRSDRLIAAWHKMTELAERFDGLTVEKVLTSSGERPFPSTATAPL